MSARNMTPAARKERLLARISAINVTAINPCRDGGRA
jgi:hypothetical protein